MPELPEVEVVRRGLAAHVVGRTVSAVEVHHPRPIRRQLGGEVEFRSRLQGQTITDAVRRGKFLWLSLADEQAVLVHLGMSGQLLVQPSNVEPERHLRVVLSFADHGPELRFIDQRMFGGMTVVDLIPSPDALPGGAGVGGPSEPLVPQPVAHIARDPLDPAFDDEVFVARLRAKRTGLKRALLDQTLISGIGNIYADEALWRARLHYARPTETLTRPAGRAALAAARDVMSAALAQGGTSFDALYVNVNGESGYFARNLDVYGREGQPCRRCGSLITREAFMNRSSHFCPSCQRKR